MGHSLVQRQHVALDFAQLDDKDLHDLVAGIKQAATTSQLVLASQPLQTSLAALLGLDLAFTEASTTVTDVRAKLKTALATQAERRSAVQGEIRVFASLTERGARSPTDIEGTGLPARVPPPRKKLPPEVPEAIDTVYPRRGHGKAMVSVHETGRTRRQYAAEYSLDPFGPTTWAPLGVGNGKTRTLTGASGTKIWVRFATVRGQIRGEWCTPTLVTIP